MFAILPSIAWGTPESNCKYVDRPIVIERQDISVSDMGSLISETKGCVTVVELWASWCGPCVKIAPEVEAFHQAHPNIAFISISADATGGAAEKFWRSHPPIGQKYRLSQWTMAELHGLYANVNATFPEAIPYFVVLDAQGKVQLEIHEPSNLDSLEKTISRLTVQPKEKTK